jgi:EAL domain-containing protein (putative c-di-GMP-specific phosphodiesterase class I)
MNLTVVAEGVEDEVTLDWLKGIGCDIAQGFYFARPMPFSEYIKWLELNWKDPVVKIHSR